MYYAIYLYLDFWKPQMVYPFEQVQRKQLYEVAQVHKLTTTGSYLLNWVACMPVYVAVLSQKLWNLTNKYYDQNMQQKFVLNWASSTRKHNLEIR